MLDTQEKLYAEPPAFDNPNSSPARCLKKIRPGSRVLEIGCGSGFTTERLARMGCRVTAVELVREAAQKASPFCEQLLVGDIERGALERIQGRFDHILFGDVLEHLTSPGNLLRELRDFLEPDGCVLASIPNIAHYSARLSLLLGRFEYQQQGILDSTHLRFFTHSSVQRLFSSSGYRVTSLEAVYSFPGISIFPYRLLPKTFLSGLLGWQFVLSARVVTELP